MAIICRNVKILCAAFFVYMSISNVAAADLAMPTGAVLLKVTGEIDNTNMGDEAWFDLSMLKALGVSEINTDSPWTNEITKYSGVLLHKVMQAVGARSRFFEAKALNKYQFNFTNIDYDKYPVLIAWSQNNQMLSVRTLGPLRIMFPFTDYSELNNEHYRSACVWQLIQMAVY